MDSAFNHLLAALGVVPAILAKITPNPLDGHPRNEAARRSLAVNS